MMYEMTVEKMTCGGCAAGIKRAIQSVDSSARIDVDLKSKQVRVDTTAEIDAVKLVVINAGFPVTQSSHL